MRPAHPSPGLRAEREQQAAEAYQRKLDDPSPLLRRGFGIGQRTIGRLGKDTGLGRRQRIGRQRPLSRDLVGPEGTER